MVIKYLSTQDKHSRVLWDKRCHQSITSGSQKPKCFPLLEWHELFESANTTHFSCLRQSFTQISVPWALETNNVFRCCSSIFKQNLKAYIFHVLKNHHISLISTIDESLNLKLYLYQLSKNTCSVIFCKSTEHQKTVVEYCKQNQILSEIW